MEYAQPRFKATLHGQVIGWYDTAAKAEAAIDAERPAEDRTRTGNTPTCEDCGKDYDHCDCAERDRPDVLDYQPGD